MNYLRYEKWNDKGGNYCVWLDIAGFIFLATDYRKRLRNGLCALYVLYWDTWMVLMPLYGDEDVVRILTGYFHENFVLSKIWCFKQF